MRILCLHGRGTNVEVIQMLGVATHIPNGCTFDFHEGSLSCPPAPEIAGMPGVSSQQKFLSYFDLSSSRSCEGALKGIEDHVSKSGPFDALMAFSEGAAVASTFILSEGLKGLSPFKMAIFFCGGVPADPVALQRGEVHLLALGENETYSIKIPTVHVYGAKDPRMDEFGIGLSSICQDNLKTEIIHGGGHEIPGRKMDGIVSRVLSAIREARGKGVSS
ncbi:uncharacterized protein BDR25DRAFT_242156 [Lindgomyces ingoldianus]|uniref:Uncharacterized protein n=1 Tax=Lindgomyces ingoldianus TaxID=673940 RepID=A0ACB6QCA4_9PLEO|nr:uncharacterized protein BDR25DRAFT_242156 [Lindgomyces ingoldianus]KAF2464559.1 hypothetical protein BDR25DRAFT_242156 [Lindgomyces ingoldianus]